MWKDLWKRSIALGDVASWNVLMFLKIVTKWPEIQKSKLNNSLFTFYSITYFTIFTCFAISWNFNFAVNLVTSFSCPSSETQGQIKGARESLNGRKNMTRRKVKNGEKSPWGQCLTRPVPTVAAVLASDWCQKTCVFQNTRWCS